MLHGKDHFVAFAALPRAVSMTADQSEMTACMLPCDTFFALGINSTQYVRSKRTQSSWTGQLHATFVRWL